MLILPKYINSLKKSKKAKNHKKQSPKQKQTRKQLKKIISVPILLLLELCTETFPFFCIFFLFCFFVFCLLYDEKSDIDKIILKIWGRASPPPNPHPSRFLKKSTKLFFLTIVNTLSGGSR